MRSSPALGPAAPEKGVNCSRGPGPRGCLSVSPEFLQRGSCPWRCPGPGGEVLGTSPLQTMSSLLGAATHMQSVSTTSSCSQQGHCRQITPVVPCLWRALARALPPESPFHPLRWGSDISPMAVKGFHETPGLQQSTQGPALGRHTSVGPLLPTCPCRGHRAKAAPPVGQAGQASSGLG